MAGGCSEVTESLESRSPPLPIHPLGGGYTTPPPPSDPDFKVGKHEILQKEILIWAVFLVHKPLDFWVPGPPPAPLKEKSAGPSRTPNAVLSSGASSPVHGRRGATVFNCL